MSRKNFTEREKTTLLSLVENYKGVIENKGTNAVFVSEKNDLWNIITTEYNAQAELPRTAKQLHTLYFNMKRKTRQHVANENTKKYSEKKKILQEVKNENTTAIKELKKDAATDKKGIAATGGGTYQRVLTDAGAQMLALIGDQIKPLSNACDSATEYFDICNENNEPEVIVEVIDLQMEENPSKHQKEQQHMTRPRCLKKRKTCNETTDLLKRKVYRKKLESAIIEKQTKFLEHKIMLKKQKLVDIEIKIKEAELAKLS